MDPLNKKNKYPRTLSPTPLRDWINRQPLKRRIGFVSLFALLIACGTKANLALPFTPVPATHQLLFVLIAGVVLGSRLGSLASVLYLILASMTGFFWPQGSGTAPLSGILAGYLWSLPLVAYLSGYLVERMRSEKPVYFAMGVSAGIAVFNAFGSMRLMSEMNYNGVEGFIKGSGFFMGQNLAQGALAVFIGWSASNTIQARERK